LFLVWATKLVQLFKQLGTNITFYHFNGILLTNGQPVS
jgi:hypothetical protein